MVVKVDKQGGTWMIMNRLSALLYGWITIFLFMLVSSFILALIIRFSNLSGGTLEWITLGLGLFYLFIGGFLAGLKGKDKGWMLGALTGLGYSFFILLYKYLAYDKFFTGEQWLYHGLFLIAAILGGIFGVNTQANGNEN
jgi:putative membrane protein (TIGR04086 family)